MARIVLLLPTATYRATDFVEAARRLGAEVVVASERAQALAPTMGDKALELDLSDIDGAASAIVSLSQRTPVDAVVAVDDSGVLVAAEASRRLGLAHNPSEAVRATRDKLAMRRALSVAAVRQPQWTAVGPLDDVGEAASRIGFPCVVKPLPLSASRGVIRADTAAEATAAAGRIREILADAEEDRDGPLLVEEFIPGVEVAVEGLLADGRLEVLAVFDKPDPLDGPYFEETIYVTPSRLPGEVVAAVSAEVGKACTALGLVEGPIHGEVRVDGGGHPVMLEVASRSIGGLCSRSLRFGAGVSLEEIIVGHALGRHVSRPHSLTASGVMMLPIRRGGRLDAVRGRDDVVAWPGVEGLEITVPIGRSVRPLPEGDRYLGFLFARAGTPAAVEATLRQAASLLEVDIS